MKFADAGRIVIDTETTWFMAPIFVVDCAAQRMQGWNAVCDPFRMLVNQGEEAAESMPPERERTDLTARRI